MNATLQGRVQQVIDGLVESGDEIGLQVAAYVNGELVVDTWSGVADEDTGQLVDGDTLFTSWSTTKGFVATCLHILADRGQVDYDTPVATYWPEFGVHGKDVVTVREAITHRAGVPQMPEGVTPEMMTDWDAMCAAIASHKPLWKPGTTVCYHAWTFGWIIGELVRRIDGRPIAQFAREELCQPLGIEDFYLGIPDAVEGRVAPLKEAPSEPETNELALRVMPPHRHLRCGRQSARFPPSFDPWWWWDYECPRHCTALRDACTSGRIGWSPHTFSRAMQGDPHLTN